MNNDTTKCVYINNILPIDEYYLDKNNTTYYSCNNSEYNSIDNCKKCVNQNSCYLCSDGFTFINGNKTNSIEKEQIDNHYYQDPNDNSNYESCTKIDPNCLTCLSYNICSSCEDDFGLYKDENICINISEQYYFKNNTDDFYYLCNETIEGCIQCLNNSFCLSCDEKVHTLIDNKCLEISSLGNRYYKDLITLKYLPCDKGINNCEFCYSDNNCIKCFPKYTKINSINSTCYLMDDLPIKNYYLDPNDESNYIKCSNLVNNCSICNSTQCLLCDNNFVFINDDFSKCLPKSSINLSLYFSDDNITYYSCEDDKYKNNIKCIIHEESTEFYTNINTETDIPSYNFPESINIPPNNIPLNISLFLLQAHFTENKLHLFIIPDSKISENIVFSLTLVINSNRIIRSLEEKEIIVEAKQKKNNNNDIIELFADLEELNITDGSNIEIKSINSKQNEDNNVYYINSPVNYDNLNTGKINELINNGEIDFSQKALNENYTINIYKIERISQGCDFNLITDIKIKNNKNIGLLFQEKNNKFNSINSNCILSQNNNYQIKCSLNQQINNYSSLKDYIEYNENELCIITLKDKSSNYLLNCDLTNNTENVDIQNQTFTSPINNKKEESGLSSGALIGIIAGAGVLFIIITTIIICVCCRPCNPCNTKIPNQYPIPIQPNIQKKCDDIYYPVNEGLIIKLYNFSKITFRSGGEILTIMIEKNKTINELLNLYLYLIEKPYYDKNTQFKCGGQLIDFDSSQTIGKYFNYSNDIIIDYFCSVSERGYNSSRINV